MPYCTNCGKQVDPGEKYCVNCGDQLSASPLSQATLDNAPAGKPFSSIHSISLWLIGIFIVLFGVTLIAIISDLIQIQLINQIAAGQTVTLEQANSNDSRQALIGFIALGIQIILMVLFLIWFHRAHQNLNALGASNLKYSPGWAVGGFFVPIWNLFRPYQVAGEIWKASNPDYHTTKLSLWQNGKQSSLVIWWWLLYLLANYAGWWFFRSSSAVETIDQIQSYAVAFLVTDVILIVAIILVISLVHNIDRRQALRHLNMNMSP